MGFGNRYKILTAGSDHPGSNQHKVVEFVKKWLLCGGWSFDLSEYAPVISPGKKSSSASSPSASTRGVGADGYVRPPRWKQFMRRVRAKSKKVQSACCEGLCFHPAQQPLNYCSTDSYERNFDRGREFWEENNNNNNNGGGVNSADAVLRTTFAAPASYATTLHPANSSTPILWEDAEHSGVDHSQMVDIPASIWQRREPQMKLSHPITVSAR